jgi:hypothetical protein
MFLRPGLQEFNSRARSISPLPPTGTHGITTFNQLGDSCNGPFLSPGTGDPAIESPISFTFPGEGVSPYVSFSSGDFSTVSQFPCVFIFTDHIL